MTLPEMDIKVKGTYEWTPDNAFHITNPTSKLMNYQVNSNYFQGIVCNTQNLLGDTKQSCPIFCPPKLWHNFTPFRNFHHSESVCPFAEDDWRDCHLCLPDNFRSRHNHLCHGFSGTSGGDASSAIQAGDRYRAHIHVQNEKPKCSKSLEGRHHCQCSLSVYYCSYILHSQWRGQLLLG